VRSIDWRTIANKLNEHAPRNPSYEFGTRKFYQPGDLENE
jgi:hypothetical protein